jgi:hypothetical protein
MSPRGVEVIVHQHELPLPNVDDVVGAVEIADRLGVLPQTVSQWVQRSKGRAGKAGKNGRHPFPPPRWTVSTFPAWYWPDVAEWARITGRLKGEARP